MLLIFGVFINSNSAKATEKQIPKIVSQYVEAKYQNPDYKAFYIMKWNNCDVYRIINSSEKGIVFTSPIYILYNGKKVYRPTIEEMSILRYDARIWQNYKYKKDLKKLIIDDNTEPPNIPPALYTYANKYMRVNKNVKFLYIMDWKDQHVYRTYWSGYSSILNELTIILYDGHTIRRPNKEEFKAMLNPMSRAYENYLRELTRSHNKG